MILTQYLSNAVEFDLSGLPKVTVTDTSAFPEGANVENIRLWITQPDQITIKCDDIHAGEHVEQLLRLDSDQEHQNGQYVILMQVISDGDVSELLKVFELTYVAPVPKLVEDFDILTPKLQYRDETIYEVVGYSIIASNLMWAAILKDLGVVVGVTSVFDIKYAGAYYSAYYTISLGRRMTYRNDAYPWLTVIDNIEKTVETKAVQPPTLLQILTAMHLLLDTKTGCGCGDKDLYSYAMSLLDNIIVALSVDDTTNLYELMDRLIRILKLNLPVTNSPLLPWDYSSIIHSGDGGGDTGGTTDLELSVDIDTDVTTFQSPVLVDKTIKDIFLSGIRRKFVYGLATDVPSNQTFVVVKTTGELKWEASLQGQWLLVKYV